MTPGSSAFVPVRLHASTDDAWRTASLSEYLKGITVLIAAAEALAAETVSNEPLYTSPQWIELTEAVKWSSSGWGVHSSYVPEFTSAEIVSIEVGSIDLVVLLSQAGAAAGAVGILRSLITGGPGWIENWAGLRDRLRVQRAESAVRLREMADKLERMQDLGTEQQQILSRLVDDNDRETVRGFDRSVTSVRRLTSDAEVMEVLPKE